MINQKLIHTLTNGMNVIAIVFAISLTALGQNQLTCRILDQYSQLPIPAAKVHIADKAIVTASDDQGYFHVNVTPSDYLIIEKPFYETLVVKAPVGQDQSLHLIKREYCDFDGGFPLLVRILQGYARYPSWALIKDIQGWFYVLFTIDSLGQMDNIKTINSMGKDFEFEITEALKKVPDLWLTAETTTTFILPVIFKINNSKITPKKKKLPQGILLPELYISVYTKKTTVRF